MKTTQFFWAKFPYSINNSFLIQHYKWNVHVQKLTHAHAGQIATFLSSLLYKCSWNHVWPSCLVRGCSVSTRQGGLLGMPCWFPFISHKPWPVLFPTIWAESVLKELGTNTGHFKVHLTRTASTWTTIGVGRSTKDILFARDWSRESTLIYPGSIINFSTPASHFLLSC